MITGENDHRLVRQAARVQERQKAGEVIVQLLDQTHIRGHNVPSVALVLERHAIVIIMNAATTGWTSRNSAAVRLAGKTSLSPYTL